ncbi:MAG TPA: hypothetical protein PK253_14600 [Spirochaetota bacterium]|nr:hypothetical protein [Spirochaetota bacterium]
MKKKAVLFILLCFCFGVGTISILRADEEAVNPDSGKKQVREHPTAQQSVRGLYWNNNIGLSYNYLGFKIESTLYYSIPLIEKPGILFKTTKVDLGVQEMWTPSCNRASFYMKLEPLAIFDVVFTAGYDYIYKELYGGIYKFSRDDVRRNEYYANNDDRKDNAESESNGGGFRMSVTPTFKVAIKGLAALYSFTADYHVYNFSDHYYDPTTFMLHKGNDIFMQHDAKIVYLIEPIMLRVGVRFIDKWVESNRSDDSMSMMGLLLWTPMFDFIPEGSYPYIAVLGGSYIKDRYYENDPYLACMIGFNWKIQ